jgi:hypothetical protein
VNYEVVDLLHVVVDIVLFIAISADFEVSRISLEDTLPLFRASKVQLLIASVDANVFVVLQSLVDGVLELVQSVAKTPVVFITLNKQRGRFKVLQDARTEQLDAFEIQALSSDVRNTHSIVLLLLLLGIHVEKRHVD